ncbi:hypothetical protein MKX01_028897 [Papaver californicum]|nr:hypothetical protein MKX01_028897 [Papaver californicum]
MDDFKRNQIPTFWNWDFSDGLPITQYFESARQAGLVRYSCGDRDLYGAVADDFLYSNRHSYQHDIIKPPSITVVSRRETKGGVPREKRYSNNNISIKEQKKHGRIYDVTEPAKHHQQHHSSNSYEEEVEQYHHHQHNIPRPQKIPKAVDEDLYKFPPELLYKPKRNKMLGFFSCLVPTCAA